MGMLTMIKHGEEIITNKYYDGEIISTVNETKDEHFTDKQYLIRDIIEGVSILTSGNTRHLTIRISLDKQDRYKLTRQWRV